GSRCSPRTPGQRARAACSMSRFVALRVLLSGSGRLEWPLDTCEGCNARARPEKARFPRTRCRVRGVGRVTRVTALTADAPGAWEENFFRGTACTLTRRRCAFRACRSRPGGALDIGGL